jgi:GntR family transcriptional regulator
MFSIDYKSRTPIYKQIIDNVSRLAVRGILAPESQLPSVRSLAIELSINPNTIAKAYAELERESIIYSVPGKGSFITGDIEKLRQRGQEKLRLQIEAVAEEAQSIEMTGSEFISLCQGAWHKTQKKGACND